jgi:hypothetical protein
MLIWTSPLLIPFKPVLPAGSGAGFRRHAGAVALKTPILKVMPQSS